MDTLRRHPKTGQGPGGWGRYYVKQGGAGHPGYSVSMRSRASPVSGSAYSRLSSQTYSYIL